MKIVEPKATILTSTPDAIKLIERCGRICYKSEDKITEDSAENFVRMIVRRGHDSVLEHATATFHIVTDRGVTHEIVRHRIASYSQESTRYCNYGGADISFIEPPMKSETERKYWKDSCRQSEEYYKLMMQNGSKPQIARSVLPNALKTEIIMTANFRSWRNFLQLRTSSAAHPQIRTIAFQILDWFKENYPVIIEDIEV